MFYIALEQTSFETPQVIIFPSLSSSNFSFVGIRIVTRPRYSPTLTSYANGILKIFSLYKKQIFSNLRVT